MSLFITAFFKISLRRLSYQIHTESGKFYEAQDKYYSFLKKYEKISETTRLKSLAEKKALSGKKKGQVIQVIDGKALIVE